MSSMTMPAPGLRQRRAQLERSWRLGLERVTQLSVAYHDATASEGSGIRRRARRLARRTVAERQALAEIEAALDRIETGTYGRCEQCHGPIEAAVLARYPQARYCAACDRPASLGSPLSDMK